jgi:CHAT domain-containing protein
MSYNSFSQTDTDSTKIVLTKPVAKLVIQDIIGGDQLKIQLKTTEELLAETNNKLDTQGLLVVNLETQINNYQGIIDDLNSKSKIQDDLSKDLEKALKAQRRRTFLYKIGTIVGGTATLLLLVQK